MEALNIVEYVIIFQILDISKCLKELRQQRMHLVQMVGQYKFVYSVIIQYIGRARLI